MSEALDRRLAAVTGLALTAAVAAWWLGSTHLALDQGSDASRSAADALQALWLVRGMAVALLSVRGGAVRGWQHAAQAAVGLIAPAWPLLVLLWSASTLSLAQVALMESLLLAAALVLPLLGLGLRRALKQTALADVAATGVGAALLAALWFARGA